MENVQKTNEELEKIIEPDFKGKMKSKNRGRTFFGVIFGYIKRKPMTGILLVVLAALSAASTVLGPKIIQNIMACLMAPMYVGDLNPAEGGVFNPNNMGPINTILDGLKLSITPHVDISGNYYTQLGSLHLQWQDWVYVQLGLFAAMAVFTYFSNLVGGIMGKNIEINLRNVALEKLVKQDMSYYSDKKIGEILTKVVSDTQIIGDQAQQVPVTLLSAIITFFGSLAMMFTIDVNLSIVVIITMAIILFILFGTFGIIRKIFVKVRSTITDINGDVTDRIATVRLIKASGTEEYETERFKEIHKKYYTISKKAVTMQSLIITVMITGISSVQIVIVCAAAILYNNDPTNLSIILSSFISAVGTMVGPIFQLIRVVVGIIQASTCAQRIYVIIDSNPRFDPHYDKDKGTHIENINGDIIFKDVEFAYPEKPDIQILPKFNFEFKHGKSYAFVGETGAGKSTISKLLLRFYDPTKGSVLINGTEDLKDVNLASYLDKVGYVEQDPQILFGNVYDNIKYGRFDATDEEVIAAATQAELHGLVETWPDGYNTILGERGFMLSGGQKQRLVIARMFLKDPSLLILDEATSALDNIVEKEIQGNLEALMVGRTTVSIAHRLSTIKNCDQIIVLAPGKGIAQVGTFDELKSKPGHFKKLYEAGLMD